MASSTDSTHPQLARLLEQLRHRLECAHELALAVRGQLARGATGEIIDGSARLETVAQEFKLLVEEYERLPPTGPDVATDRNVARARLELGETAARIARSSALAGGLLERLIAVSRGRLDLFGAAQDGTYSRDGRIPELDARGARLKEWV